MKRTGKPLCHSQYLLFGSRKFIFIKGKVRIEDGRFLGFIFLKSFLLSKNIKVSKMFYLLTRNCKAKAAMKIKETQRKTVGKRYSI